MNAIGGPETVLKHISDCISRCWNQHPERRPPFAGKCISVVGKYRDISRNVEIFHLWQTDRQWHNDSIYRDIVARAVIKSRMSWLSVCAWTPPLHLYCENDFGRCTGWPKKLYIFQHTISLEPFKIKWKGFHQNVSSFSKNKDSVAIFVLLLNIFLHISSVFCWKMTTFDGFNWGFLL